MVSSCLIPLMNSVSIVLLRIAISVRTLAMSVGSVGAIGIKAKPPLDGAPPRCEFVGEYGTESGDRFNNVRLDIPSGFYAEGSECHFSSVTDSVDPGPTDLVSLHVLLQLEVPL